MKTVGYFINTFLRRSEGFIYEQIKNIGSCSIEVLTRTKSNEDTFPYDKVNSIERKSKVSLESLMFTLTRKSPFLERTIKDKNISLIHAHFGVDAVYALPLAEKFNLPLITTFHGYDITRLPKFTLYPVSWLNYKLHFKELQNKGSLFLAVSDFIRKKMIDKGFPVGKVRTHYLGMDTGIKPVEPNREKIVLAAGRLVEKKGFEYLIKACADLALTMPDIKLIICGTGPLESKLKTIAKTLGIEKKTEFPGWQNKEEVLGLMKRARIFVLPSVTACDGDAEGLGMVLLEAMALGIPCVGTHSGGIPEAVTDNETGFLAEEKNYLDLAEKIRLLLSDYSLCLNFGKNGRKQIEERFDIKKQAKKLESIYTGYK